jgi:hypothetical protein
VGDISWRTAITIRIASGPVPANADVTRLRAAQPFSTRVHAPSRGLGNSHLNFVALQLAQAIGIERMGQEDADADEGKERRYDLDHSFPPKVEMPGRARLRNSR